jgi:hypothetical protein
MMATCNVQITEETNILEVLILMHCLSSTGTVRSESADLKYAVQQDAAV